MFLKCSHLASARTNRAEYAGSNNSIDSSAGVMLGKNIKVGKTASSKTSARPVCSRRFAPSLGRKQDNIDKARERMCVLGSSSIVINGGIKRFQLWSTILSCKITG